MLRKVLFISLLATLASVSNVKAQMAIDPEERALSIGEISLIIDDEVEQLAGSQPSKSPTIVVKLQLFIESEVGVEIRDALGHVLFESTTIYPEGEQKVKVKIGDMDQGVYFVKVNTALESQTEMVVLEKD